MGLITECGIDVLALLCIGLGFGFGFWWASHLMHKILDSHSHHDKRRCKHKLVYVLKCVYCNWERKVKLKKGSHNVED